MNVGTKSILFGVHQFIWHPITVWLAWYELFGMPDLNETICIVIHDWGYWGSPNMDGVEGEQHPEYAANLALKYLDTIGGKPRWGFYPDMYHNLCLYHSRHYAKRNGHSPSDLCWADKLSIKYDPWWFYLPRAWLSGELFEYRKLHSSMAEDFKTHRAWYDWASRRAIIMGKQMDSSGITFHPDPRGNTK